MKKVFILLIVASFFTSCEKEQTTESNSIHAANSEISSIQSRAFKITIKLYIDGGTRKTADSYNEFGGGDGSTCQGRGFCLGLSANISGNDVIVGDAILAPEDFTPVGSGYVFGIKELDEGFEFSVNPDDITPEQKDITFEGGVFILDHDYEFTAEILEALNVESCVLHAGTYPVTENAEGTILFNF